jgi:hypothetical protein
MRISKAVAPILEALGAPASKFAGKSLSKLITAVSPYVIDFIDKSNRPQTYVFEFDVTQSGGTFNITPRDGVTFEAIKDALSKTPNVYAKAFFPDGSTRIIQFQSVKQNHVGAAYVEYHSNNIFAGVYVEMHSDNTTAIVVTPLENAQSS